MKLLQSAWKTAKTAAVALTCWTAIGTAAFAERTPDPPSDGGGITDYTLSYALVLLCVGLGLMVVLHASNRRERQRPEGYVEKNILKEE